jgi:hypothetical protein
VRIGNDFPPIDGRRIGRILGDGVPDATDTGAAGSRGHGLFVARTYVAKTGRTIEARNAVDGVDFVLRPAVA